MEIQLTEIDRRDLERHAWSLVAKLAAPRAVRLLWRDKLVLDMIPRLKAARAAEQEALMAKWKP